MAGFDRCGGAAEASGDFGGLQGELIVQDDIDQRLVDADAAVVLDEAELAKAIHEEADAGAGGADHLRQSFLGDGRNEGFRLTRLAKFGHQEKDSCQALLAGVEELIDQIGLGAHAPAQQEFQVHIGEGTLLVHDADHLFPRDLERRAGNHGRGGGHMQRAHAGQRLLSNELPGGDQRDRALLAFGRNDGEFCAAGAEIEDGNSRISLRKEDLFGQQMDDFSSHARFFQKDGEIEGHGSHLRHVNGPSRMRSSRETVRELTRPLQI